MQKAILLFSGGKDSMNVLKMLLEKGIYVYCLRFSYHRDPDAKKMVNVLFQHNQCEVIDFSIHLDDLPMEDATNYMPGRNSIFLSIAAGFAETMEIKDIFIGCVPEDYDDYPDCRKEYINAFNDVLRTGFRFPITVHAPLL